MARTIEAVEAWARQNPLYTYKDGTGRTKSWAGLCEAFVNNAGGFNQSFGSAMLAGDASGWLNPNWREAGRGSIHYWAGVGGDGHVAFDLGGGRLLMASSSVTERWGTAMGTISFTDYARLGIPYRGHTKRHGTEQLAPSSQTAGTIEEDDMSFTDEDRKKLNAVYDAVFLETPTSRGTPAGILNTLGRVYDGLFKKTTVTSATTGQGDLPGGTLTSLSAITQDLAAVKKKLGA
ncbi:hypothetical protein ACL9RL_09275 [Plantibacter sp. Mn2098]|uniref:hypothetical protein n=1 Tax=Plantibacter sp. Mn2098 TaxID=3395266 RepID=UPI003BE41132